MKWYTILIISIAVISLIAILYLKFNNNEIILTEEKSSEISNIKLKYLEYPIEYDGKLFNITQDIDEYPKINSGKGIMEDGYYIFNHKGNIIKTSDEANCFIFKYNRQCIHTFEIMTSDGLNFSIIANWTAPQWSTDNFYFNSSHPTIIQFKNLVISNLTFLFSDTYEILNRTWYDKEEIITDELIITNQDETKDTGLDETNKTIENKTIEDKTLYVKPYKQFSNYQSTSVINLKGTVLRNRDLFVGDAK